MWAFQEGSATFCSCVCLDVPPSCAGGVFSCSISLLLLLLLFTSSRSEATVKQIDPACESLPGPSVAALCSHSSSSLTVVKSRWHTPSRMLLLPSAELSSRCCQTCWFFEGQSLSFVLLVVVFSSRSCVVCCDPSRPPHNSLNSCCCHRPSDLPTFWSSDHSL